MLPYRPKTLGYAVYCDHARILTGPILFIQIIFTGHYRFRTQIDTDSLKIHLENNVTSNFVRHFINPVTLNLCH